MTWASCGGLAEVHGAGPPESQAWQQVLVYFGELGMRGSMSWMMLTNNGEALNAALRGCSRPQVRSPSLDP